MARSKRRSQRLTRSQVDRWFEERQMSLFTRRDPVQVALPLRKGRRPLAVQDRLIKQLPKNIPRVATRARRARNLRMLAPGLLRSERYKTLPESVRRVIRILKVCQDRKKRRAVLLSLGRGNGSAPKRYTDRSRLKCGEK